MFCIFSVFIQIVWDREYHYLTCHYSSVFGFWVFTVLIHISLNDSFLGPVHSALDGVHHNLFNEQLGLCPIFHCYKHACHTICLLATHARISLEGYLLKCSNVSIYNFTRMVLYCPPGNVYTLYTFGSVYKFPIFPQPYQWLISSSTFNVVNLMDMK